MKQKAIILLSLLTLPLATAIAQPEEEITVIGVTPNHGLGLPLEKLPYNVQSADAADLERTQSLDLSDYLRNNLGSISSNDAANNPLQADLQFRGYSASPLLGLAQGIAVYQNGVRVNEPLGDTVNWDLLPESAIHGVNLISGANPLFGLNTLGGALDVSMKNGFNSEGHHAEIYGGSFQRIVTSVESGGNNGEWGYYGNINYFDENGWRDESASDAINFYGTLGWRSTLSELNLSVQHGDSELLGNGAIPIELTDIDRAAIFTAPDRTENNLIMFSIDGNHNFSDTIKLSGNAFYRQNNTDSFNGDGTELSLCEWSTGATGLLDGLEEDDLEEFDLDDDELCDEQYADADALQTELNRLVMQAGEDEEFDLEDLIAEDELSGDLANLPDEDAVLAINNQSDRKQKSYGTDIQLSFLGDLFGNSNSLVAGIAYYNGRSWFTSQTELATLDEQTRSTEGLGTALFIDEAETRIKTETETFSGYFLNAMELTEQLTLTLSARMNNTLINLQDLSGERPELNGEHDYFRINPGVGLAWQFSDNLNFYGNYSESNRAPTPIELACNSSVYEQVVAREIADAGPNADEDAIRDSVEFECRLPNAFLADPPLEDVVTRGFEAGIRGDTAVARYHLGFFHSTNHDDILFQTTGRATGLFANINKTRRLGLETLLS
ncbi:MAG: TonB-dependent receptor, partial [Gammaproteobacteria bacterium]